MNVKVQPKVNVQINKSDDLSKTTKSSNSNGFTTKLKSAVDNKNSSNNSQKNSNNITKTVNSNDDNTYAEKKLGTYSKAKSTDNNKNVNQKNNIADNDLNEKVSQNNNKGSKTLSVFDQKVVLQDKDKQIETDKNDAEDQINVCADQLTAIMDINVNDVDDSKIQVEDNQIFEKSSKLDLYTLVSVINSVSAQINQNTVVDDKNLKAAFEEQISALIDDKLENSNDGLLSFFDQMNNNKLDIINVLSELSQNLKVDESSIQDKAETINSLIDALTVKLSDNNMQNTDFVNTDVQSKNMLGQSDNLKDIILDTLKTDDSKNIQNQNISSMSDNLSSSVLDNLKVNDDQKVQSTILESVSENLVKDTDYNSNVKNLITDIKKVLTTVIENVNSDGKTATYDSSESNMMEQNSSSDNNSGSSFGKFSVVQSDEDVLKSIIDDGTDSDKVLTRNTFFNTLIGNKNIEQKNIAGTNAAGNVPVVRAENFADDIVKSVKFMSLGNLKQLTVKITPENLGEMTIKIIQEDGVMKAHIKASSKDSYDLLARNSAIINKELTNQNIKIQTVNVSLNDDTTYFDGSSFENGQSYDGEKLGKGRHNSKNVDKSNEKLDQEDNKADIVSNINMLA